MQYLGRLERCRTDLINFLAKKCFVDLFDTFKQRKTKLLQKIYSFKSYHDFVFSMSREIFHILQSTRLVEQTYLQKRLQTLITQTFPSKGGKICN